MNKFNEIMFFPFSNSYVLSILTLYEIFDYAYFGIAMGIQYLIIQKEYLSVILSYHSNSWEVVFHSVFKAAIDIFYILTRQIDTQILYQ